MKVSIFGIGYVGVTTAACLSDSGHDVTAVDVNAEKIADINAGRSPIVEPHVGELVAAAAANGLLRATDDACAAVLDTDVSIVCVGTPSRDDGSLDTSYVDRVCRQIGEGLKAKNGYHVVALRSTLLPGSMRHVIVPALEESCGKKVGIDYGVAVVPEFLREGSAVADFRDPARTIIGNRDSRAGDVVAALFDGIDSPTVKSNADVAAMVKYADNAFHALKVCFANEIGRLAKAMGVDGRDVMELVCMDDKLNLSKAYLKPGFAFGGSCLPKDLRALTARARELEIRVPVLENILDANQSQIDAVIEAVRQHPGRRVGILGLSFKVGTDDLRESPILTVIQQLLAEEYDVVAYDRLVQIERLVGANRAFSTTHAPKLKKLLRDTVDAVVAESDVLILANGDPEFITVETLAGEQQLILDLVGLVKDPSKLKADYWGIAW
jgi:GDP-mannose 6-dehydrogenase